MKERPVHHRPPPTPRATRPAPTKAWPTQSWVQDTGSRRGGGGAAWITFGFGAMGGGFGATVGCEAALEAWTHFSISSASALASEAFSASGRRCRYWR